MEFSAVNSGLEEGAEAKKESKFSEAQEVFVLKQDDDGLPVAEICRKAGIRQSTYLGCR